MHYTITRDGRIRQGSPRKPGLMDVVHQLTEVFKLILDWLLAGRKETIQFRSLAKQTLGVRGLCFLPVYETANYWQRFKCLMGSRTAKPFSIKGFPRTEKALLASIMLLSSCVALSSNMSTSAIDPLAFTPSISTEVMVHGPVNWLDGTPRKQGSRSAVMGAYQYATEAGYAFVTDESMLEEMVATGELVKLEGPYITLHDVKYPYVLPVVRDFANRLGQQYAERGCGKLVVTSALRTLEQQGSLANGSDYSVHPTGMSLDFRRSVTGEVGSADCLKWLESTLLSIEGNRRIDVTFENRPKHLHVVVVPHVYAEWLASREPELEGELKWLATALYFEASFGESMEGYRAIGWTIRNRVRSREFPDTILEVVAEGAAGRSNGGCQFSFMCDGKAESIHTLCARPNAQMSQYWLNRCEERWEAVVDIAEQIIAEPESQDLTGGAVLYYAGSMSQAPYWADSDMKEGTIITIDSHVFACSVHRGDDACRKRSRS